MSTFPDIYVLPPIPSWDEPMMTEAEIAPLLGLTTPLLPPLDAQVAFAGSVVSRVIRDHCGRRISSASYTEEFPGRQTLVPLLEGGGWGVRLQLSEWPVASVTSVLINGVAQTVKPGALHQGLGTLLVEVPGAASWGDAPIRVLYVGGHTPLPFDLQGVYLDLMRRQLTSMGADLAAGGSALPSPTAPIKAVTVGALKVDYAVNSQPATAGATGSASAVTEEALTPYRATLARYCSHRVFAAASA